jgi:hypothetical protein
LKSEIFDQTSVIKGQVEKVSSRKRVKSKKCQVKKVSSRKSVKSEMCQVITSVAMLRCIQDKQKSDGKRVLAMVGFDPTTLGL